MRENERTGGVREEEKKRRERRKWSMTDRGG